MDLRQIIASYPGYAEHIHSSISELQGEFEATKKLLLKNLSDENFNAAFQSFYKIVRIIPLLKSVISIPQIVRGRPNYNGEIFSEKSDISYNSKRPDLIKLGRFNRVFEPLFYGSLPVESSKLDYVLACALECGKELTDQHNPPQVQDFTIGAWVVETPFDVVTMCFNDKHLIHNPSLKEAVDGYMEAITTELSSKASDFIKEFLFFYSNLSSQMSIDEKSYYVLTGLFVAVRYYYKTVEKSKIYGLIYPSATTESEGLNIVLTRHAVDNHLRLDKVVMYRYFLEKSSKTYIAHPCSDLVRVKGDKFVIPNYIPQGNSLRTVF
jgi:hypothetical protein